MSLSQTPSSERIHISFFGRRNAGKSSLVNAVTEQELSVVSNTKGTTTDPVQKAMELLPLGPVVVIDTPGFDDLGELGEKRVQQTRKILAKTDLAVLVVDCSCGLLAEDREFLALFEEKKIPWLLVWNKADLQPDDTCMFSDLYPKEQQIAVSALQKYQIFELKEKLGHLIKQMPPKTYLVQDLLPPSALVVLVTPVDESAPKGRLILPQQMVLRDILDADGMAFVTKETELPTVLQTLMRKPDLVITDSQVFKTVSECLDSSVLLTSFSILMARYKGYLNTAVSGISALDTLKDGDRILLAEGCTHHRQCNDIGTVKIPRWIKAYTGEKKISIHTCSGTEFPEDLSEYSMVIHCGGCMLNEREIQNRMECAVSQNIPFTNYGIVISKMNGILDRSLELFKKMETKDFEEI